MAQSSEFRWLDQQRDRDLWSEVSHALRQELIPDGPESGAPGYRFKYIALIGVYERSALVVLGYRTRKRPLRSEAGPEYFKAFAYSLDSRHTVSLDGPGTRDPLVMFRWKLIGPYKLEPGSQDIVFTYFNCWECEPEQLLSSFRYNAKAHSWEIRTWGDGLPLWWQTSVGVVVWEDIYGGDDTVAFDCLYGVTEAKNYQLDSVAVRCREVHEPTKGTLRVQDATVLYSFNGTQFTSVPVTDKTQLFKITSELCRRQPTKRFCRSK